MNSPQQDALIRFEEELEAYAQMPRPANDADADARADACRAHAQRVRQILALPDTADGELRLHVDREDMGVWVILPGCIPVPLAGIGGSLGTELSARDRGVIGVLLVAAQDENNAARDTIPQQLPTEYSAPAPYPVVVVR